MDFKQRAVRREMERVDGGEGRGGGACEGRREDGCRGWVGMAGVGIRSYTSDESVSVNCVHVERVC